MPADRSHPRQNPVSCDSCRKKKLKCDREQPCSNCTGRSIPCLYQSRMSSGAAPTAAPKHSTVPPDQSFAQVQAENEEIKARLKRLEEAILRRDNDAAIRTPPGTLHSPATTIESFASETENPSKFKMNMEGVVRMKARFGNPDFTTRLAIRIERLEQITWLAAHQDRIEDRTIILPDEARALEIFELYVKVMDPVQHITHVPTVRAYIRQLYNNLATGQTVTPDRTMLVVVIIASIGMHWAMADPYSPNEFYSTAGKAFQTSTLLLRFAIDILDYSRRACTQSLEVVQATILLVFSICHLEGFSPRSRSIFTSALFAAKDLGLHKTDLDAESGTLSQAQIVDKEIRRRVWWHLASTDWGMAYSGGHHDGTYSVQLRHMKVNRPRNVSDDELSTMPADFTHPDSVPTIMSYSLCRIRINALCRKIADAAPDMTIENISPANFMALDREFQNFLDEMPVYLRLDAASRSQSSHIDAMHPHIVLQRYIANLFIHARRCQLHIPFLLKASYDDSYGIAREGCLKAARAVIWSHDQVELDDSLSRTISSFLCGPIHVFFYATVVLVMDLCINKDAGGEEDEEERKAEIGRAFKTIEDAKQKSQYAGVLLDSLMVILRKHQVRLRAHHPLNPTPVAYGTATLGALPDVVAPREQQQHQQTQHQQHEPQQQIFTDFSGQGMEFDDLWRSFVDDGPHLDTQSWDALINDLDFMV